MLPYRLLSLRAAAALFAATMLTAPIAKADDEIDQASLRAEKLAADADALVEHKDYSAAVELYLQASQAAPAAVLAFNIASIYDRHLHAPALALEYYKKCLASPDVEPNLAHLATARVEAISGAASQAANERERPAPSMTPPTGTPWSSMKTWALVSGGAGIVAIGIGATFGVIAKGKDDDANQYCTGDVCTDARALTLTKEASNAASIADIAFMSGALLLAGGVALWLIAPKQQPQAVGVSKLIVGPALIRGTWW